MTVHNLEWTQLRTLVKTYLLGMYAAGIPAAYGCLSLMSGQYDVSWLLLTAAAVVLSVLTVRLPSVSFSVFSIGDVFTFLALMHFGPGPALITYWADITVLTAFRYSRDSRTFFSRIQFHRFLFNLAASAISVLAMGFAYSRAMNTHLQFPANLVLALTLSAAVWFVVNTTTLSAAVASTINQPFRVVLKETESLHLQNFFASAALAGLISLTYRQFGVYVLFFGAPLMYRLYRYHVDLIRNLSERQRNEQELALAEETQRCLLTDSLPASEHLFVRAFSRPTRYVGGDFYDFISLPSGALIGVLADVSGKGVAASLLSSMLLGCLHMQIGKSGSIIEAAGEINRFLCDRTARHQFATMMLFAISPDGTGHYINAGHTTAYLFRDGCRAIEKLDSNNTIIGMFPLMTYSAIDLRLEPGDILVIYSDGLTEAEDPNGEMLGENRLKEAVLQGAHNGAVGVEQNLLLTVKNFTRGWPQTDDMTFIVVERSRPVVDQL